MRSKTFDEIEGDHVCLAAILESLSRPKRNSPPTTTAYGLLSAIHWIFPILRRRCPAVVVKRPRERGNRPMPEDAGSERGERSGVRLEAFAHRGVKPLLRIQKIRKIFRARASAPACVIPVGNRNSFHVTAQNVAWSERA